MALHWKILIGMLSGVLFGILLLNINGGDLFVNNWIKPLGTIFVKLLKLIAIPLILASLIKGISDLKDISKFKTIGSKTIITYILTTVVAISIGLILVNLINPGSGISSETVERLTSTYSESSGVQSKLVEANNQIQNSPLQFLVDTVPDNAFKAMSNNSLMLQVIFFTIFLGISMLLIGEEKSKPLKSFFDSLNFVVLKMVDLIMKTAPYAVFALLASVITSSNDPDLLLALLKYSGVVCLGLFFMIIVYSVAVYFITNSNPLVFLKKISPAQLLAFSTSSSAATLPLTMDRVENHIGVDREVSSFVLPVGATINMDGTAIMQGVATVFIAQVFAVDLTVSDYLMVILTATLASVGTAGVPGVGLIMLAMVLNQVGLPVEGIAIIIGVDRLLDMTRTAVNVTGDCMVTCAVAKSEGELDEAIFNDPNAAKDLEDYHKSID